MEADKVLKQVNEIFKEVLDNENILLKKDTVADDVDGWDSLTHIQLVITIEKYFGIRFISHEIRSWNNVGEMISSICSKI